MGESAFAQRARVCFKGNVTSFHTHWEDLFQSFLLISDRKVEIDLPHLPNVLAQLVRFEFKIASVDLTHHLRDMRLRLHVVLRLGLELIEKNHPAFSGVFVRTPEGQISGFVA